MNFIDYITPVSSPNSYSCPLIYRKNYRIMEDYNHDTPRLSCRRLEFNEPELMGKLNDIFDDDIRSISPISLSSDDLDTIGECGVCYENLPIRSNHIFTTCGHLFCIKCLFNWNNTSSTCPLCRENLYDKIISNNMNEDDNISEEDIMFSQRYNRLDRYVYDDIDIEWTESVEEDDDVVFISNREINQLREVRYFVLTLIQRRMYLNSLLSNIDFDGQIYHSFIPRINYTNLYHNEMDKSSLYEFIICSDIIHDGDEINFFGYINNIEVIEVPFIRLQENQNWESSHEYSFKVSVFNPNIHNCIYDEDNGIFKTITMTFRFSEIRRMYSIWSFTGIYD